jgi:hypothetical protein
LRDPLRELAKEKTRLLSQQGFYFAAEGNEISNLRLLEDIYKIIEVMASEIPLIFLL